MEFFLQEPELHALKQHTLVACRLSLQHMSCAQPTHTPDGLELKARPPGYKNELKKVYACVD